MLYVCFTERRMRASRPAAGGAVHVLGGSKMAELHYMEMGWSGSGWMDPLPMENTPAPAPTSRPSAFDDFSEPSETRARPSRPRRKSAKKTTARKSTKRSRGAKKSARKGAKKGARTSARKSARKSTRKSARKSAKKGARKSAKRGRTAARKGARKGGGGRGRRR